MQNQNLELHFLHQVSACLNLCRAHPLFEKLLPHAQTFDYRLLEAYPYVRPEAPHAHGLLHDHQHGRPGSLPLPDRGG